MANPGTRCGMMTPNLAGRNTRLAVRRQERATAGENHEIVDKNQTRERQDAARSGQLCGRRPEGHFECELIEGAVFSVVPKIRRVTSNQRRVHDWSHVEAVGARQLRAQRTFKMPTRLIQIIPILVQEEDEKAEGASPKSRNARTIFAVKRRCSCACR